MRRLLFAFFAVASGLTLRAQTVDWTAPASVASGTTYWVGADSTNGGVMTIRKNGLVFATGGGGVAGAFSTDTGPQTVNYTASGKDVDNINFSGSTSVVVLAPSNPPTVTISGPSSLVPGQSFTATSGAADVNGDLNSVGLRYQGFGLVGWWAASGSSFSGSVSGLIAPITVPATANVRTEAWDNAGNGVTGAWRVIPVIAPTTFTFGNLAHTYDGAAKTATVTASPSTATFTSSLSGGPNAGNYTVSATANGSYSGSGSATLTIAKAPQASVAIAPPSTSITVGNSVTFTAGGGSGSGAYTWGGSASGTGTSKTVAFPTTGTFSITVFRAGDTNYLLSNTATATITVNPAPPADQAAVTVSPPSTTVTALGAATFTAAGGSGTGAYTWGGAASGTGTTTTVTFNTSGTSSVTVFRAASSGFNPSNTATASVTVNSAPQSAVTISPTSATVTAGGAATFTASGGTGTGAYTWGGTAGATGTGTSKTITFPTAGTFTVTVSRAGDATYAASNTATATVTVSSPDTTAPTVPTGLAASAVTTTSFTLSWTASSDAIGVTGYEVFRGGVSQGTVATTSLSLTGLASGTTYSLTVRARDAAGNWSAQSTALAVTTLAAPAITTQPAAQTVATGATASFSVAATGTAPLAYQWRKNAVNLANGGNVSGATTATLALTNVQAADAASYTVVVTNAAGSATSAAATLTVNADTTAPTVPTGLAASAVTTTSFTLSWTASTDAIGVTGYEVFRGGVSQGTVATTSLSLTGLASGTTYSLTVRARDAAGNWSAQSTAFAVTTTVDNAADNDGDGVPNGIETQLGTNPNSAAQSDTTNQTQTKILQPKP